MKATAILKDMSDLFYDGYTIGNESRPGFRNLDAAGKWQECRRVCGDASYKATLKIGNGSFRDQVDLNGLLQRGGRVITCKEEPRKGYRLITFEFA